MMPSLRPLPSPSRLLLAVVLVAAVAGAAAAAPAPTAQPAPAGAASTCGNGLLEVGESCDDCPADCVAADCTPGAPRTLTVDLTPQQGVGKVGAAGILVAFRPRLLTLPGTGNEPAVSARVKPRTTGTQVWVNDLGYGVRIGASSATGLVAGPLVDIELTACEGAPPAGPADVNCRIESCAFGGGRLRGCACTAVLQAPIND